MVRCRLYLIGIRTDPVPDDDYMTSAEPLFEEDRAILDALPKPVKQSKTEVVKFRKRKN